MGKEAGCLIVQLFDFVVVVLVLLVLPLVVLTSSTVV